MLTIHLADPLDVLMSNIEHQLSLWHKDSDPARIDEVLKMEIRAAEIQLSFRINMN